MRNNLPEFYYFCSMKETKDKYKLLRKAYESIRKERRQSDAVRHGYNLNDYKNAPRYITQEIYDDIMEHIRNQRRMNLILVIWMWILTISLFLK